LGRAALLYRISSVVLILFAAGHTFGFLNFKAPTPEGRAVLEAMKAVRFQVQGTSFSYGGFYTGFGLSITVNILFSAFLSWHLGTLADSRPAAIGFLGWAFCGVQVVSVALSCAYFAAAPAVLSALLAVLLGWAAWLVEKSVI